MPDSPPTPPAHPHRRKSGFTRRAVVGGIGAVAAAAALTPMVSAATANDDEDSGNNADSDKKVKRVPKTRTTAAGAAAAMVTAKFPIQYVGLTWTGPKRGANIRFAKQDGAPGDWQKLHSGCACGTDTDDRPDSVQQGAALVAADGAYGYELTLPDGAEDARSVAIDARFGPERQVSVSAGSSQMHSVEYLSRADWGADESKRFYKDGTESSPPKYYPVQALTVHHTATPNGDPDPAATVRAIYEMHAVTNDWGDIGYHFLIDEAGRIYEGRWSGEDGLPAHDKDGNVVTAFHAVGYNSGNIGVALLGTLNDQPPTQAARDSLVQLLALLATVHDLDPEANITYKNPVNGTLKDIPALSGHRDWLVTDCPGGSFYADLPALRRDVAEQQDGARASRPRSRG